MTNNYEQEAPTVAADQVPPEPYEPPEKLKKLYDAVRCSFTKLEPFRKNREAAIKQYVGSHYSDDGSKDKVPVNLLALTVGIYTRQLAAKNPKVICNVRSDEMRPIARKFELAMNHLLDEIRFKTTMKDLVLDAMFSMGVVKIGLEPAHSIEINGFLHDIGQPFADRIDLDDFVFDMAARRFDQMKFIGDRYVLPIDDVLESGIYNEEALKHLAQSRGSIVGEHKQHEHSKEISRGKKSDDEDYEKTVELWDLYLPRENRMLTVVADHPGIPPLRDVEWDGPENGPYRLLSFQEVPNQIMPLPTVATLIDLHDAVNRVFNKLVRQVERQKTVTLVRTGKETDGVKVRDAGDGEMIPSDDPKNVQEVRYGGADAPSMAAGIQFIDRFSHQAGNLDTLGGLSPMSDTVGQDELLSQNASKSIAEMGDRTMDFARDVIRDLGWYLWHHPLIEVPVVKVSAGLQIPTTFSPEDREGDFYEYNLDIVPYSMQEQTPQARLQGLMQLWERVLVPMATMAQAQGMDYDLEAFFDEIETLSNLPVKKLLTFARPPQFPAEGPVQPQQQAAKPGLPTKPPVTRREVVRTSRPGATRMGKDAVMTQMLMGQMPQAAEAATAMRPVG